VGCGCVTRRVFWVLRWRNELLGWRFEFISMKICVFCAEKDNIVNILYHTRSN